MKFVRTALSAAMLASTTSMAFADQTDIYLFLNSETTKTEIDGLSVRLDSELIDQDMTERDFMRRPRVSLTCRDDGRQLMHVSVAEDLDPWPAIAESADLETDATLKSQSGSFEELKTRVKAYRVSALLTLAIDVTGRAEAIARTWYEGMPIQMASSPTNGLKDLNLILFPDAPNQRLRDELAAVIKGCSLVSVR
ncbi:hypothetical protein [Sinorhizobium meliloti]|uniref:hypothetical protein n=1 Tax=Rhizobium meliloti TaxID=382 RepID=UPI000FD74AE5|nr:hypothetical protein [Sinorhizobium meliloti]RVI43993.1 hypothetical protein CN195_27695 [Sinorhizobium meliloti]